MCFFTFFEFNGHRYNKQAALTLVEYQQRRIDELEKRIASLEDDLLKANEAEAKADERRRATENELGQARKHARHYKAELDRLKEKAPVRGKGGRFVSKKKPC